MTDSEGRSATVDIRVDKGKRTVTIEKSTTGKPGADSSVDEDIDAAADAIVVGPGKHGKRVRVGVLGADREFDSFNDFVHTEPGLAFMVVAIVALVFLSPVLAIGLILWYRMRKARMLNETMLKLAEKGVVPPAEALDALSGKRGGRDGGSAFGGARSTSRRSRSAAVPRGPTSAKACSSAVSGSASRSGACSTTARRTGSASCSSSSGSATSCSGGSKTAKSRRAAAARTPTLARLHRPAGRTASHEPRERMAQPEVTDAAAHRPRRRSG